jgi:hypothetical protein
MPAQTQKNGSFSLIERVILSAGAMLIFSVSFQLTKCTEVRSKLIVINIYTPKCSSSRLRGEMGNVGSGGGLPVARETGLQVSVRGEQ